MSSDKEWDFFQDDSGRWRWLHIDAAGKRSVSPSGFDSVESAKKHAKDFGYVVSEPEGTQTDTAEAVAKKPKGEEWYFFRADDTKWRWLKVTAEGKRQISKEVLGFRISCSIC